MIQSVLITGASGNVGSELIKSLRNRNIYTRAGVRDTDKEKKGADEAVIFDFANPATYKKALEGVEGLFLLRPPQISDVTTYLFPVVDEAKNQGIKQIVFLSLMGAQWNIFAPHHKVEKYLKSSGVPYTFIRPSFYMQNLSTFYKDEIKNKSEIFVPAGYGKTSFIDVRDIAEVSACVFTDEKYLNQAYTLTGSEVLTYFEVAGIMSAVLGKVITYRNPSSNEYIDRKRKEGMAEDFISVMSKIYLVSRLRLAGGITHDVEEILGRKPIMLKQFVEDYKLIWNK